MESKSLRIGVWLASVALAIFAVLSFIPFEPAIEAARRAGFSDEVIRIGLTKSFESRLIFWGTQFAQIAFVCWVGLTQAGPKLAEFWLGKCRKRKWLATLATAFSLASAREIILLPFSLLNYFHNVRWEMLASQYTLWAWGGDYLIATGVEAMFLGIAILFFWSLIQNLPKLWWCVAPIGGGLFAMLYALLAPLILDPMTNRFEPLDETKWKDLKPRLMALVEKANLPVREILVMDASKRSTHSNAYFAGFGATRRIVLYDTLLQQLNAEEVEAVLAHEIGHWQNDHIVYGILLGTLGMCLACWLLDTFLSYSVRQEPWRAESKNDPRLLGAIMLILFFGQWIVRPIENKVSRYFEVQADMRSLELIKDRQFAIECEKRLAIQNKSNVAPAPWNSWMFSTHPSSVQRIEAAKNWQP